MKKMVICMMVVGLAMPGFSTLVTALDVYLDIPEQEVERIRDELKDAKKLKEYMGRIVGSLNPTSYEKMEEFKKRFNVGDEPMQTALMDIIREASTKTGWKRSRPDDAWDMRIADRQLLPWAITCLGICANTEGKKFLMDIATDSAKDDDFRWTAICSYLRRADAQETRDTLVLFLTGDMKTTLNLPYHGLYFSAISLYDNTKENSQKREAIIFALTAALMLEKDKEVFSWADKLLAERSTEYAESPQRKAALERMNKPPEKETP